MEVLYPLTVTFTKQNTIMRKAKLIVREIYQGKQNVKMSLRRCLINTATTAYTITYDTFGNMVPVSAGGNVLSTYIIAFAVLLDCSPSSDMHSSFNQLKYIIGNYISITQFICFNMGSAGIDILRDTKKRISVW